MSEITDTEQLETTAENPVIGIDQLAGDFKYDMTYDFDAGTGLSERTVDYISAVKKEAPWIREFRQNALKTFLSKPLPTHWASKDLETIDFSKIRYYLSQGLKPKRTWDEVQIAQLRIIEFGDLNAGRVLGLGQRDLKGEQVVRIVSAVHREQPLERPHHQQIGRA